MQLLKCLWRNLTRRNPRPGEIWRLKSLDQEVVVIDVSSRTVFYRFTDLPPHAPTGRLSLSVFRFLYRRVGA